MRSAGRLAALAWAIAGGLWWLSTHSLLTEAAAGTVNGALVRAVAGLSAAAWLVVWWVGPVARRVVLGCAALGSAAPLILTVVSLADTGAPGSGVHWAAVALTAMSSATCVLGATVARWPERTRAAVADDPLDEAALWKAQSRGEDPTATPPGLD